MMKIRLLDFGLRPAFAPCRMHDNDAGADVFATGSYVVPPHTVLKMPLGVGLELPDGYAGFVFPRSSWAAKGLTCELPPIDSSYRGEIHAIVTNNSDASYHIKQGARIGQLVIMPVVIAGFSLTAPTERGEGAFGSTGE